MADFLVTGGDISNTLGEALVNADASSTINLNGRAFTWNFFKRLVRKTIIIQGNGSASTTLTVAKLANAFGEGARLILKNLTLKSTPCFLDVDYANGYGPVSVEFENVKVEISPSSTNFIYVSHNYINARFVNVEFINQTQTTVKIFNIDNGGTINSFYARDLKIQGNYITMFNITGDEQYICAGTTDTGAAIFDRLQTGNAYLWSIPTSHSTSEYVANISLLNVVSFPGTVSSPSRILGRTTLHVNDDRVAKAMGYYYRVGDPIGTDLTNGKEFRLTYFNNPSSAWVRAKTTREIVYNISGEVDTIVYDPNTPIDSTNGIIYEETSQYALVSDYIGSSVDINIASKYNGKVVKQIKEGAFRGKNIESIIIPSNIEKIGGFAFAECRQLKNVYVYEGLKTIEEGAFQDCQQLQSIMLPRSVTTIGSHVLENCTNIINIKIPFLGDNAENKSMGYLFGGTVPTTLRKITIYGDNEIPAGAFQGLSGVKEIFLLGDLTKIGEYAFKDCTGLEVLEFNPLSPMTEIGAEAFSGCSSLLSLEIPNSVSQIGAQAFLNCSSLKSIKLPTGLQSLDQGILSGCSQLEKLELPFIGNIPEDVEGQVRYPFGYIFGTNHYSDSVHTSQVYYDGEERSQNYFTPRGLKEVKILGGNIPYGAFSGCNRIEKIILSNSPQSISKKAFYSCDNLIEFNIPETVEIIEEQAFYRCSSLKEIVIPDTVKTIGKSAFEQCSAVNYIKISQNSLLETIDEKAFYECKSLLSIFIPQYVNNIENQAFYGCGEKLVRIQVDDRNQSFLSHWDCLIKKSEKALILGSRNSLIPEDINIVDKIAENAFKNCSDMKYLYIPNNIQQIAKGALSGCSNLERLDTSIIGLTKDGNVMDSLIGNIFGEESFPNSTRIRQYQGNGTFYIPTSLKYIGIFCEQIPPYSFDGCTTLKTINIHNGTNQIGDHSFNRCYDINTIFMPKSMATIQDYAFDGCSGLEHIYYYGTTEQWENISIGEGNDSLTSAQIVRIANAGMDFLGFTFNGVHSWYNLGVLRVVSGDRLTEALAPQMKEITAETSGNDGQFYFGTWHQTKTFQVDVAFDNLSEEQFRKWKKFCNGKEIGDLIFDEMPYKVYSAKISGNPQLNFLCFDGNEGQRIYKGEGQIQFTCYWPYAHTPNSQTKISARDTTNDTPLTFEGDGRALSDYDEDYYTNKNLWKDSSGLTQTFSDGTNNGDLPAHFKFKKARYAEGDVFAVGDAEITMKSSGTNLVWDSRTGMVSGVVNGSLSTEEEPISFLGTSIGTIPLDGVVGRWGKKTGEGEEPNYDATDCILEYDYWYY